MRTGACRLSLVPALGLAAIAAFVIAAAPAQAARRPRQGSPASWLTYGFDYQRTGYNPTETTIRPGNVGGLHQLWSDNLGGLMIAQPVEAAGVSIAGVATTVIYEGTENGDFYAIRASDGQILWHDSFGFISSPCFQLPNHAYGISGSAAISFTGPGTGVLYVATPDGDVHALDLATGAEQPGWPVTGVFTPPNEFVWSAVNLFGHRLYVTVASICDTAPFYGNVAEIDVTKHAIVHRFYPTGPPSAGISGGGIWGSGGASIDPSNGHVFVATGNARQPPYNYRYSDSVVELGPGLGVLGANAPSGLPTNDPDFGATPTLFKPAGCPLTLMAAKQKSGILFIYAEGNVSAGYRQRIQMASSSDDQFNGLPAWDPVTNMLYVPNSSDAASGIYKHGLVAFKATNCKLSLAWQRTVGPNLTSVSSPTVANGLVYYGDGAGQQEFAFNATNGNKLWSSPTIGNIYAAPTVVNGQLLVPSWNDSLQAYGP